MRVLKSIVIGCLLITSASKANELSESDNQIEHFRKSIELIQTEQYLQAESSLQRLITLHPQNISYLNNLAVVLMSQGKTEEAINILNNAIATDKNFSLVQNNISQIYAYMASKAYTKALANSSSLSSVIVPPILSLITEQLPNINETPIANESNISEHSLEINAADKKLTEIIEIKKMLQNKMLSWSNAWMQSDVMNYLSHYSKYFKPVGKLSYQNWKAQRRYRLTHSAAVSVTFSQLLFYINEDRSQVIIEFVQKYKTGEYKDTVKKQLYWNYETDRWLISREQVIETIS